ncbi:hypothetical protein DMB44_03390 [Thermoplasma sp. Kam2015]|nr:hypothetical protein DMB44_03390 [Thermoplasma sp. Kam2015]
MSSVSRGLKDIELIKARFIYLHDNCTFNFIDEGLSVKLLWSMPYKGDRMITYESVYPTESHIMAKSIINKVRGNPKTLSVFDRSLKGRTLTVGYLEWTDNSPFFLSNRIGMVSYDEYTMADGDVITIVTASDNFDLIRDNLSNYGKIMKIQIQSLDPASINGKPRLTAMQEKVLGKALEMGFFNYPKDVHLKEIAEKMGVSVVSVDQYLREAQRKLAMSYLNG